MTHRPILKEAKPSSQSTLNVRNNLRTSVNAISKNKSSVMAARADEALSGAAAAQGGGARAILWSQKLHLPSNQQAYNTLNFRKISEIEASMAFRDGASDLLTSEREARAAKRLWGTLVTAEPHLKSVPFVPYLCTAVSHSMPTSPLAAVEVALHLFANVLPSWLTIASQPSMLLVMMDDALKIAEREGAASSVGMSLWEHLNFHCGANANDYFWLPLQTFFMYNLPQSHSSVESPVSSLKRQGHSCPWQETFDSIVLPRSDDASFGSPINAAESVARLATQSQRALVTHCIAIVIMHREALMKCNTVEDVHATITSSILLSPKQALNPSDVAAQRFSQFKQISHIVLAKVIPSLPELMALTTVVGAAVEPSLTGLGITPRVVTVADPSSNYYPLLKIGALSAHFSADSPAVKASDNEVLAAIDFSRAYAKPEARLPSNGAASTLRSSAAADAKYKSLEQIEASEADLFRSVKNELDTLERMRDVMVYNQQSASPANLLSAPANTTGLFAAQEALGAKVQPATTTNFGQADHARQQDPRGPKSSNPGSADVTSATSEPHMSKIEKGGHSANTTSAEAGQQVPDSVLHAISMLVKALKHQARNTMPQERVSLHTANFGYTESRPAPEEPKSAFSGVTSQRLPVEQVQHFADPNVALPMPAPAFTEASGPQPSQHSVPHTVHRQSSFLGGGRSGINATPLPLHASSSLERAGSEELLLRVSRESSGEMARQRPSSQRYPSTSVGPTTTSHRSVGNTNRGSSIPTTVLGETSKPKGILRK